MVMLESSYDNVEINYTRINDIRINSLVYFKSSIWKIYDIENDVLYLTNPTKENIGVLIEEIHPIIITQEVMELCGFNIISQEDEPLYYIGKNIIQTKTIYSLKNEQFNVDIKLKVVLDYKFDENNNLTIDTLNLISKDDKSLKYLHQIQNIFKDLYNFELIDID